MIRSDENAADRGDGLFLNLTCSIPSADPTHLLFRCSMLFIIIRSVYLIVCAGVVGMFVNVRNVAQTHQRLSRLCRLLC